MHRRAFLMTATVLGTELCIRLVRPAVAAPPEGRPNPGGDAAARDIAASLTLLAAGGAVVRVHKSEMGQGVLTALPMLIAEELELPFERVRVELALGAVAFRDARGNQTTGYSSSVSGSFLAFRKLGAAARVLLEVSAARIWSVPVADVAASAGVVRHRTSGRTLNYAELIAASQDIPLPQDPALKPRAAWRLIGTPVARIDTPAKVDGSTTFGVDVRLPGLRTAMVARCPVVGGQLSRFDAAAAMKLRGTEQVFAIPSGVAVVARDFWSATRARDALRIEWRPGSNHDLSSDACAAVLRQALDRPGSVARRDGDDSAHESPPLTADYHAPFLAHAALEPLAATVWIHDGHCELWLGTQAPSRAQDWAAQITGLPLERVIVHTLPIGGAFGRRGEWDWVIEAVEIAQRARGPVKLLWTREEDLRHDFYRPMTAERLTARLGPDGAPQAMSHRIAGSSVARRRSPQMLVDGRDPLLTQGSSDQRYRIANLRVDFHAIDLGVPVGFWRSVGHSHTGFSLESFIDELAHAARRDPLDYRLALLAGEPRMQAVLRRAAAMADWGAPLPAGRGRGIACMESYGSYVAEVAEIELRDATIIVNRICCAIDCGTVVNPSIAEQQVHSAIVFGLSAALLGEITLEQGAVVQSSYHDYPCLRIDAMPQIDVALIDSEAAPGGCGEPATPIVAPAVANAIFAATGQRLRRLPLLSAFRPASGPVRS